VGATVAALEGMGRKWCSSRGDGKGQDFSPLRHAGAARHVAVVLIGRDATDCRRDRVHGVVLLRASDMHEAVRPSLTLAHAGECRAAVAACASFDMFRNYEHRAQVFATRSGPWKERNDGVLGHRGETGRYRSLNSTTRSSA